MINIDQEKINELLERGVEEVIVKEDLEKRVKSGKQLRIKFGIDPTGSALHLGHAVPLRKLRQFQDMGHQVILLIGDYTAMIGDPTGRDETRPLLTVDQIKKNMTTYIEQAEKILDKNNLEIRYNSEWYAQPNIMGLLMELTGKITLARVLDRADFKKRIDEGHDIRMQEVLYPVMQGYDSVMLESDVELGGTDQKFNLLMGRKIQKRYNKEEQDIMTVPILEGLDGEKKMSKTYDNYIALLDSPQEIFGKIMSIPDNLIIKYFELVTDLSLGEIRNIKKDLDNGLNPRDYKMKLGYEIVRMLYSMDDAQKAEDNFVERFSKKQIPDNMPELDLAGKDIVSVLVEAGFCASKSDARRDIIGGGVKINDEKVNSFDVEVKSGDVVQKGKRFFVKIK